jgi:hypothetical protein
MGDQQEEAFSPQPKGVKKCGVGGGVTFFSVTTKEK